MSAMFSRAYLAVLALSAALFLLPDLSRAEDRVALVIGNGDYRHTAPLRNPINDANDMAAKLGELGFDVIIGVDLDEDGMWTKIEEFATLADGAESALLFYAGHGLQFEGQNYLVPTDAALRNKLNLRSQAIRLDDVLDIMNGRTNLVFLDACRDNPLADRLARSFGANRTGTVPRGLAPVETDVSMNGLMISYATAPGKVASDGSGDNSPYTAALLQHIGTEGQSVGDLMTEVTGTVLRETRDYQRPWHNISLVEKFYFVPPLEDTATPSAAFQSVVTQPAHSGGGEGIGAELLATERVFWESIKDSNDPADFEAYGNRFPGGFFAELAIKRLAEASRRCAAERVLWNDWSQKATWEGIDAFLDRHGKCPDLRLAVLEQRDRIPSHAPVDPCASAKAAYEKVDKDDSATLEDFLAKDQHSECDTVVEQVRQRIQDLEDAASRLSNDEEVRSFQTLLTENSCNPRGVDGSFGNGTVSAVRLYNKRKPAECQPLHELPAIFREPPTRDFARKLKANITRLEACRANACYRAPKAAPPKGARLSGCFEFNGETFCD